MSIKIVPSALGCEIELILNGVKFHALRDFETMEEAKQFLADHGLKETD